MRSIRVAAPVLLVLATACAGRYVAPVGDPVVDPAKRTACVEALREAYPDSFKLVQRLALTVRGRRYDFIGYLIVERGRGFRALTMGEMGGKVFDLESKGGERRILLKPASMPANPLIDGAMGDIACLFDPRVETDPSRVILVSKAGKPAPRTSDTLVMTNSRGDVAREDTFDLGGQTLLSSLEARDGRIVRRAVYEDYRLFDGWPRPLPARIRIENRRWRYDLEIQLLEFRALPKASSALDAR